MSKNAKFISPYYKEDEWNEVKELLGREPIGLHRIVKFHPKGHPAVLEVFPYSNHIPFPTLYWLCCPIWKKEISHFEKDGLIKELEEKVLEDRTLKESLQKDHENYRDLRTQLFYHYMQDKDIQDPSHKSVLFDSGIGGMKNFKKIKCLHLQLAYELASPVETSLSLSKYISFK